MNDPLKDALQELQRTLQAEMAQKFKRRVSIGDLLTDRWENARKLGWGEGSSCYDNVLVLGDVKVGRKTWIGPNVILDGSAPGGWLSENIVQFPRAFRSIRMTVWLGRQVWAKHRWCANRRVSGRASMLVQIRSLAWALP